MDKSQPTSTVDTLPQFKAIIFGVEGVLTNTVELNSVIWEKVLNEFIQGQTVVRNKPFVLFSGERDYRRFLHGTLQIEGLREFLKTRHIKLPLGKIDALPSEPTIRGLGNRKNKLFREALKETPLRVIPEALAIIHTMKAAGIKVGVVSASRSGRDIIENLNLTAVFDTIVDGNSIPQEAFVGNPGLEVFLKAAHNLGVYPHDCVSIEAGVSGLDAAKEANYGLVIGLARYKNKYELMQLGADIIIGNLKEVTINRLNSWFLSDLEEDNWKLVKYGYEPDCQKLYETFFTVGNGYMGCRGSLETESISDEHYPGNYLAGIYNTLTSRVHGKTVSNNDLVNCPNWTKIEFKIGHRPYLSPLRMEILSYVHTLNMHDGTMERVIVCQDRLGQITRIHITRLVSMDNPHCCAIRFEITPVNYSETITVRSTIDGNVINYGVLRYRQLNNKHLEAISEQATKAGVALHMRTNQSNYDIMMQAKTQVYDDIGIVETGREILKDDGVICEELTFEVDENTSYSIEKMVSVFTSLDGKSELLEAGLETLNQMESFEQVYASHAQAWYRLWNKMDIKIEGDRFVQRTIRFHLYHLMVTASPHNQNLDVGMTARGLHGEGYRGHIFWDELYILPFYNLQFPEVTKACLRYRYNRLNAARTNARDNGYQGAMYPWQTADHGREETQSLHYNPQDGSWGPDLSCRQRHVSIAIFYNVWKYVYDTGDQDFLENFGAEMMIDIARFWASITSYDKGTGKYHIEGVMGPDEFHEKQPNSDQPGLKDNAYTNVMVVWLLEKTLLLLDQLPEKVRENLEKKLRFDMKETDIWQDMLRKMNVLISEDQVIHQFDRYMKLPELDWDKYREKYGNIKRMDRILKAEGNSTDNYKIAKQADVLMLFYVLAPEEVVQLLNQLGETSMNDGIEFLKNNYAFYEPRTSHGSSLSRIVHAVISSYFSKGNEHWDWFIEALHSDISDKSTGPATEGIHCGLMAGTIDFIYRYIAGISLSSDHMRITPQLPAHWQELQFRITHRGISYDFTYTHDTVTITANHPENQPVRVFIGEQSVRMESGQPFMVELPN